MAGVVVIAVEVVVVVVVHVKTQIDIHATIYARSKIDGPVNIYRVEVS